LVVAKKGRGKEMVWEGCEEVGKASPESSEWQAAGFTWQNAPEYVLQIDYKERPQTLWKGKKFLKWCTYTLWEG
jgi:hypothetical protein